MWNAMTPIGNKLWLIVMALSGVVLIASLNGCSNQADIEKEIKDKEPDFTMPAADLCGAYITRYADADEQYPGKVLALTGTVEKVYNTPAQLMVELATTNSALKVDCYFSGDHTAEVAKLAEGDNVKIKGKCKGMIKYVIIEGCSFLPTE